MNDDGVTILTGVYGLLRLFSLQEAWSLRALGCIRSLMVNWNKVLKSDLISLLRNGAPVYAVLRAGFLSKYGIMFAFFAYDGK